ncbi:hypothetical protein [Nocardioides panzhihuensis]|uniref:Uncharacterized protein n=1 Tax=Nocardioides panzhihuensis TaxID=860243 RepID=A0A7Z0IVS6_9ACTN|nr:hypothetical protein [Nocardioides panzhihuensis]NYI81078.1 hypothetical protein [Nocardioides panzhihuensis]
MTGIPERSLRPHVKARREAELMQAISQESRTKKWMMPVAAAAAVAVMAAGGVVVAQGTSLLRGDEQAAGPPEKSGETSAKPSPVPDRVVAPVKAPGGDVMDLWPAAFNGFGGSWSRDLPVLQKYRDVLAEHLDPTGQHLDKTVSNAQGGEAHSGRTIGTKLGWSVEDEDGLGMVQLAVGSSWDGVGLLCEDPSWTCEDVDHPGVKVARVATTHDGARIYAVERSDGTVVAITLASLFGNNSSIPVSGIDLGQKKALAAAADPRLIVPELDVPPAVDAKELGRIARKTLVPPGTPAKWFDGMPSRFDHEAYVALTDVKKDTDGYSGGEPGLVEVRLEETLNPIQMDKACRRADYKRCIIRTVDGNEVFIGLGKKRRWMGKPADPVNLVVFQGPVYTVSVYGDATIPVDRAVDFVLDQRWQPKG